MSAEENMTGAGPHLVDLKPRNEFQGAVDSLSRNLPVMLEHVELQAKIRRASYLALLKEGFTEAQALELCRHP